MSRIIAMPHDWLCCPAGHPVWQFCVPVREGVFIKPGIFWGVYPGQIYPRPDMTPRCYCGRIVRFRPDHIMTEQEFNGRYRITGQTLPLGPGQASGPQLPGAFPPVGAPAIGALTAQNVAQHNALLARLADQARTPQVSHTGVEVGEVTAWRAWQIVGDRLGSVVQMTVWPPDQPLEAHTVGIEIGKGIHAFRTADHARAYALTYASHSPGQLYVWGEVELWGEIVEFKEGWHGEFAAVKSIAGMAVPYPPLSEDHTEHIHEAVQLLRGHYGLVADNMVEICHGPAPRLKPKTTSVPGTWKPKRSKWRSVWLLALVATGGLGIAFTLSSGVTLGGFLLAPWPVGIAQIVWLWAMITVWTFGDDE